MCGGSSPPGGATRVEVAQHRKRVPLNPSDPYTVEPIGRFDTSLALPTSKSITNRALLLATLADGPGRVVAPLRSDDSEAFTSALNAMGAVTVWDRDDIVVREPLPAGRDASVSCRDAGTAARFLPPAAVALGSSVWFDASEQLRARPMAELLDVLRGLGARTEPGDAEHLPVRISASGMPGGTVTLGGEVSSQFLSGLLMAAPLATGSLTITSSGLVSRPYVDLTIAMMAAFGRTVERSGYEDFQVTDLGRYHRSEPYVVEADASTASYFFALAAATGSRLQVTNLRRASLQGDIAFLDVLEAMGATVTDDEHGITVQGPGHLRSVSIDMRDMSDVMMTLACLAPFADGPVEITNVGHVRVKESDRLDAVVDGLTRVGVHVDAGPDWLTVHPGVPRPAVIDPRHDHRIAMAFTVLGLTGAGLTIEDPGCVAKTCPPFFELCAALR